jgi:hypothetical protein
MNEPDWDQICKVERDICYLYHELSEYSGIMGDLAFGCLYTLPHWEFLHLNVRQMPEEQRCFIREGCLVMLLAMAWDVLDGSGSYLIKHFSPCQQAVAAIEAHNASLTKMLCDRLAVQFRGAQCVRPLARYAQQVY